MSKCVNTDQDNIEQKCELECDRWATLNRSVIGTSVLYMLRDHHMYKHTLTRSDPNNRTADILKVKAKVAPPRGLPG
jgi:hypothetical protein